MLDKGLIICTKCGKKDANNKFSSNTVTIIAEITKEGVTEKVKHTFPCMCTQCTKCKRILFAKMSTYRKLKEEATLYFKANGTVSKVVLKEIRYGVV